MSSARSNLLKGAVKSALGAFSGVSGAGTYLDPDRFSVFTLHGVLHTMAFSAIVVVIAEIRYFKQWAEKWANSDDTPPVS